MKTKSKLEKKILEIFADGCFTDRDTDDKVHIYLGDEALEKLLRAFSEELDKLILKAEQAQIIVAYEKTMEHKPILKDIKFVPLSAIKEIKKGLK